MALKIGTIKRKPGIIWTGSFFTKNNYAKINQQILNKLSQTGEYDIGIFVDDEFNRSPGILPPLLESKIGKIPPIIEFQIFHQILPQLEPPSKGRWIIMQPWEYGSIPITWLEAINLSIDEIWVYSNTNKENYILDGVDEKKLQVIPLGIDPKIYNPDVKPMKLSTNKNFKFLFVGETMWYTGIDLVLQAFTEEFLFDEDVCLIIKDFQSSSPTARRNNIETIKNYQSNMENPEILYIDRDMSDEELASLYRSCDAFVYPYRAETFGLSILEAMACGLPVIVPEYGDCKDFCNKDIAYLISGKLVKHNQKEIGGFQTINYPFWYEPNLIQIRQYMREIFEDYNSAQSKGIKASTHVSEKFTWVQTKDIILERLKELKQKPLFREQQEIIQTNLLKGLEFSEKGDFDKAIENLNQVLKDDPENINANIDLGIIYLKSNKYEQALEQFEKSIKLNKNDVNLYNVIGVTLFNLGEYALSKKFFEKTLVLDPYHKAAAKSLEEINSLLKKIPKKKRNLISKKYKHIEDLLKLVPDPQSKKKLSLCMIVKNEEKFLPRAIESVKDIVDEIIVIDTGSTDNTIEIAEEFGAHVYNFEWTGSFSDARNEFFKYATGDWILTIDADEVVDPSTKHNIRELIQLPQPKLSGYQLKIRNFTDLDESESDVVEHYTLRLFPNSPELHYKGIIHEQLVHKINPEDFDRFITNDVLILHYGYAGEIMTERSKEERNLEMLNKAIKDEPDNPFHYFNLGLTYKIGTEKEKALENFEKAISLCEEKKVIPTYLGSCYSYSTSILVGMEKYKEAIELSEKGYELCKDNPDYWINYGSAYNGIGEYEKALDCFKKASSLRSKTFTTTVYDKATLTWKPYAGMGNTYLMQKDFKKARFFYRKALKENPKNFDLKLSLARISFGLEEYKESEKIYKELLKEKKLNEEKENILRTELANIYLKTNRIKEAIELIEPIKDSKSGIDLMASIYYTLGKFEEIIQIYEKLLETDPHNPEYYLNRGIAYFNLKEFDKAESDFEKTLELDPENIDALANLGGVNLSKEKINKSKEYYLKVLEKEPEMFNANFDMAKISAYEEKFEEAKSYLLKALEKEPNHIEALRLLANVEQKLGNIEASADRLVDILELNPKDVEALIQLGYIFTNNDQPKEALSIFERVLDIEEKLPPEKRNPQLYSGLGVTLLQLGKYEDARNSFLMANAISPNNEEIIKGLTLADQLFCQTPI